MRTRGGLVKDSDDEDDLDAPQGIEGIQYISGNFSSEEVDYAGENATISITVWILRSGDT